MIQISKLYGLDNISDCYFINDNYEIVNIKTKYIKKLTIGKRGYYYVTLNEKHTNRQKKVLVHKIVALAFIKNAPFLVINHIDGNKLNNAVNNLEFCTQKENTIHAWKHELVKRKERVFKVFFNKYSLTGTIKQLVEKTGISKSTLYYLFYNKTYSKKYKIEKITEIINNKSQETIQMITSA